MTSLNLGAAGSPLPRRSAAVHAPRLRLKRPTATWGGTALALLAVTALGLIDRATSSNYGMTLFYLVPIVAAGWWLGRTPALLVALAAGFAWASADLHHTGISERVAAWNALTRFGLFTGAGLLTALVRRDRMQLTQLLLREEQLARTDALTGLPNLRAFLENVRVETARCYRTRSPLCLAYFDLDNFKSVNDAFGHAEGDALLVRLATVFRDAVRAGDVPARLGGDEFGILFWDVQPEHAERIACRIHERVTQIAAEYAQFSLGISTGIAVFTAPPRDPELVIKSADYAMYDGKRAGKGRIIVTIDPGPAPAQQSTFPTTS